VFISARFRRRLFDVPENKQDATSTDVPLLVSTGSVDITVRQRL